MDYLKTTVKKESVPSMEAKEDEEMWREREREHMCEWASLSAEEALHLPNQSFSLTQLYFYECNRGQLVFIVYIYIN